MCYPFAPLHTPPQKEKDTKKKSNLGAVWEAETEKVFSAKGFCDLLKLFEGKRLALKFLIKIRRSHTYSAR